MAIFYTIHHVNQGTQDETYRIYGQVNPHGKVTLGDQFLVADVPVVDAHEVADLLQRYASHPDVDPNQGTLFDADQL